MKERISYINGRLFISSSPGEGTRVTINYKINRQTSNKKKKIMKIRIKGNSIRYRLTKTEVETFCETGSIKETTTFGNALFTYKLMAKKGVDVLEASFKEKTITMYLSEEERLTWATSDNVGFGTTMDLPHGERLSLLLEKDFVCLDETVEDQSDNYPNPKSGTNTC